MKTDWFSDKVKPQFKKLRVEKNESGWKHSHGQEEGGKNAQQGRLWHSIDYVAMSQGMR